MTSLAERVERAAEGSRELDAEIAIGTGLYIYERRDRDRKAWFYPTSGRGLRKQLYGLGHERLPSYTTSIDAALTLVPEHMRDEIEITTLYQVARVGINLNHGPDDGPYYASNESNSIPLALCAAALKAREGRGG